MLKSLVRRPEKQRSGQRSGVSYQPEKRLVVLFQKLNADSLPGKVIHMSQYQVSRLLRDIARNAEIAQRCRTELQAVLKNYDLDEAEKDAVEKWSVRALYDMGINPLLLLTSSMAMGTDIRAYSAALNEKR